MLTFLNCFCEIGCTFFLKTVKHQKIHRRQAVKISRFPDTGLVIQLSCCFFTEALYIHRFPGCKM